MSHQREYIRHPSDIPIHYQLDKVVSDHKDYLKNISKGGLCFNSHEAIPEGSRIRIQIPLARPEVEIVGRVMWARPAADSHAQASETYEIGVKFEDPDMAFRTRMVEQVCHIEQYKKDILEKEGRCLTSEEAAMEWIHQYSRTFPGLTC